jgi:hypothetical protein
MGNTRMRVWLSLVAGVGALAGACALGVYGPARAPGSVIGKAMCLAGLAIIGAGLLRWAYRAASKPGKSTDPGDQDTGTIP